MLIWNEQGTPVSKQFNDVYFSNQNGLEETRYVFLNGNRLPQRFANHPRPLFIVAETGFGTGLNFLALFHRLSSIFVRRCRIPGFSACTLSALKNFNCGRPIWQQRMGAGRNSPLIPKSYAPNGLSAPARLPPSAVGRRAYYARSLVR